MLRSSDSSTFGVILDRELRARLEQAAADNPRSVGAKVTVALHRHLPAVDEQEEPHAVSGT